MKNWSEAFAHVSSWHAAIESRGQVSDHSNALGRKAEHDLAEELACCSLGVGIGKHGGQRVLIAPRLRSVRFALQHAPGQRADSLR